MAVKQDFPRAIDLGKHKEKYPVCEYVQTDKQQSVPLRDTCYTPDTTVGTMQMSFHLGYHGLSRLASFGLFYRRAQLLPHFTQPEKISRFALR